uniref:AlNc14C470G11833 protein n=1 Tax=Albugo laibachii Nc14 TaxID=890382 RepID=F0X095_9STRA|nr:AlNc14C470G11833 [Albugo laibachii Nc14]|eukprot:CCA27177.1 AlNc14C470G11833 [Albugo laibachii Nc14]
MESAMRPETTFHPNRSYGANGSQVVRPKYSMEDGKREGESASPKQNKTSLPPPAVMITEEPCREYALPEEVSNTTSVPSVTYEDDLCEEILLKKDVTPGSPNDVECEDIILKPEPVMENSFGDEELCTDEVILKDEVKGQDVKIGSNINTSDAQLKPNGTNINQALTITSTINSTSVETTQKAPSPDFATDTVDTFASDLLNFRR